jgi:hypothetical protein
LVRLFFLFVFPRNYSIILGHRTPLTRKSMTQPITVSSGFSVISARDAASSQYEQTWIRSTSSHHLALEE